jgi:hypothetical protein
LTSGITFLDSETGTYSPADMLLALLGLEPRVIDGPSKRGTTTYTGETISEPLFERAKQDVRGFIDVNEQLPAEVFIGSQTLSLEDLTATLASAVLEPRVIRVRHGVLKSEQYISKDASNSFKWPIHPEGFSAPELLELARLQAWTLKPARLR